MQVAARILALQEFESSRSYAALTRAVRCSASFFGAVWQRRYHRTRRADIVWEARMTQTSSHRRAVRRAVRTECQAVQLRAFQLFGERVLDLSPIGMLVKCDRRAMLGDEVIVSFRAPGANSPWFEAEAEVARVIRGCRASDHGYCAGLRFTYFEKSSRDELLTRLAGHPPPIPQRRLRTARDRDESQSVAAWLSVASYALRAWQL